MRRQLRQHASGIPFAINAAGVGKNRETRDFITEAESDVSKTIVTIAIQPGCGGIDVKVFGVRGAICGPRDCNGTTEASRREQASCRAPSETVNQSLREQSDEWQGQQCRPIAEALNGEDLERTPQEKSGDRRSSAETQEKCYPESQQQRTEPGVRGASQEYEWQR